MPIALKKKFFLALPLLLTLTLAATSGRAANRRFALLPLSDLSIDYNGIDLATTQELARIMEELGFTTAPSAAVYDFMAKQQIYDAGFLNAFNIRKLGRQLDCDLILTGTVTEVPDRERDPGRFGLLLNGYSGRTGTILFTIDLTSSQAEEVTLLALGEPRTQAELKALVMARVKQELARLTANGLAETAVPVSRGCPCEITGISLDPDFVQSGKPVTVTIRLNCLDDLPEELTVRDENGRRLRLKPTGRAGEYRGILTAETKEGHHPLTLELPAGPNHKMGTCRESELAGYRVSNQPPPVTIELKQGLLLDNGVTVFSNQLLLVSHYPRDLPIDRWQVEVTEPDGKALFTEDYDSELPHRMFWQGWNQQHRLLAEGSYVFILRVWDRAGNRAEIRKRIAIQRTCVAITVRTEEDKQGAIRLLLNPVEGTRNLLEKWHLNLYSAKGRELLARSGKKLPAAIALPKKLEGDFIRCELDARDRIGNRFILDDEQVFLPGRKPGRARDQRLELWNKDF